MERTSGNSPFVGLLPRPPFQLRSLPIPLRWEVTRRHPYNQSWWRSVRDYHRGEPISHPAERLFQQVGITILGAIGVNGEPPDPATSLSDLGEADLQRAWLSGAVHPVTFRGLAAVLLTGLPKETLGTLGTLFLEASCEDPENGIPQVLSSLIQLQSTD